MTPKTVTKPPTLDTNLLLRLALGDVPAQYEAVRNLITVPGARHRITDLAIVEAVHTLTHHYGLSRIQVVEIIRAIITDPSLEANAVLLESVCRCFVAHPSLSFTDCYLAEDADASGHQPLLTFDRKLAHQHPAARLVPTVSQTHSP